MCQFLISQVCDNRWRFIARSAVTSIVFLIVSVGPKKRKKNLVNLWYMVLSFTRTIKACLLSFSVLCLVSCCRTI